MTPKPIRVLIVDDSVVVRSALTKLLGKDKEIEVVGTACNPYEAREQLVELKPDVMTLDIEMPRMDGLTFLEKVMAHFPLPVIMCSSLTREGAEIALKAMELGAVDIISKPRSTETDGLREVGIELIDKIKAAARTPVRHIRAKIPRTDPQGRPLGISSFTGPVRGHGYAHAGVLPAPPELLRNQHKLIAIGASTGGTEALRVVLERLPKETPPVLVVQHMPEYFTLAFSNRMNQLCAIDVKEAAAGDKLRPGLALIAHGDYHLMLRRQGIELVADVRKGPLVCRHRPSVEVLFQSVARVIGPDAIGVILTGMGGDGAQGMALMKQAGSYNIAQNEASCVVFGMPKEAIKCGGVDQVEHLERIPQAILDACCRR